MNTGVSRNFQMEESILAILFIDNCKECNNAKLSRFADSLNQDLEVVLNAVVKRFE